MKTTQVELKFNKNTLTELNSIALLRVNGGSLLSQQNSNQPVDDRGIPIVPTGDPQDHDHYQNNPLGN